MGVCVEVTFGGGENMGTFVVGINFHKLERLVSLQPIQEGEFFEVKGQISTWKVFIKPKYLYQLVRVIMI